MPDRRDPESMPLGLSTDELGLRRLVVTARDGRRVNLLPGLDDALPPRAAGHEEIRSALLEGVPAHVLEQPWRASFDQYFLARSALTEVPTMLAGMVLRPLAEGAYRVVDLIPAPLRRPFDRALGILLDSIVSLPATLLGSHIPLPPGDLPDVVDLGLKAYPQIRNSCGETMVATWLKNRGVPVALGELDTQLPFFEGTGLVQDAELRKRGFTLVSGPGSFRDLETYLAHGYPVMVNVEWASGGGHYAVVSGYDRRTQELLIENYHGDGATRRVSYAKFQEDWGRRQNRMVVAYPMRDHRLSALRRASSVSRDAQVQEGLSLSDLWVTQRLEFFVEVAYRYKGTKDDLVVRLHLNTAGGATIGEMIGGSVSYTHEIDAHTRVTVYAERLTTRGDDRTDVEELLKGIAVYVGARHKDVAVRAGYERGAFQAELQAALNSRLGTLGAEARVSVRPDGNYMVAIGIQGTF